jgi:RimJ/RimL family protein N-acetyltransferase
VTWFHDFREVFMEQLPKTAKLKDGTVVTLRTVTKQDGPALLAFFRSLPKDDRLFLKEDVTQQEVIDRWLKEDESGNAYPIVAEHNSKIVGDATLHLNRHGWQRNMAEIRCVVARELQKKGLGTILMHELVAYANKEGVNKITAKMMDSQVSAQNAFKKLGFRKEYELKDFVVDISGKPHNLVIMVNDVSALWKTMEDLLVYSDMRTRD